MNPISDFLGSSSRLDDLSIKKSTTNKKLSTMSNILQGITGDELCHHQQNLSVTLTEEIKDSTHKERWSANLERDKLIEVFREECSRILSRMQKLARNPEALLSCSIYPGNGVLCLYNCSRTLLSSLSTEKLWSAGDTVRMVTDSCRTLKQLISQCKFKCRLSQAADESLSMVLDLTVGSD